MDAYSKIDRRVTEYKIPSVVLDACLEKTIRRNIKGSEADLRETAVRHLCDQVGELISLGAVITWQPRLNPELP